MIQPLPISEEQMCALYFQVSLNEVSWVASFVLCFCISQEGTELITEFIVLNSFFSLFVFAVLLILKFPFHYVNYLAALKINIMTTQHSLLTACHSSLKQISQPLFCV